MKLLSGVRVVAMSQYIASSYVASMMADLGADVIKIESPRRVDRARGLMHNPGSVGMYPENESGSDWWNRSSFYNVLNRGQRSLTLDVKTEQGRTVFEQLVADADVLIVSVTPPVARRLRIGYEDVRAIKEDIILLSITGFGSGPGPYTDFRGLATSMEATHGHCSVTGYKDGPPSKAGRSYADFIVTGFCVFGVTGALRHRELTGQGQWIDTSLYECGSYTLGPLMVAQDTNPDSVYRRGNRDAARAPQGCYPCRGDDEWIVLSIGTDEEWRKLIALVGNGPFDGLPDCSTLVARQRHHDEIDRALASWTSGFDRYELFHRLQGVGIAAAPVLDSGDIHVDPHLQARDVMTLRDYPPEREIGSRWLLGHPTMYGGKRPVAPLPAPALGGANEELLQHQLRYTDADVRELEAANVISREPLNTPKPKEASLDEMVGMGVITKYDPDYRARLGYERDKGATEGVVG